MTLQAKVFGHEYLLWINVVHDNTFGQNQYSKLVSYHKSTALGTNTLHGDWALLHINDILFIFTLPGIQCASIVELVMELWEFFMTIFMMILKAWMKDERGEKDKKYILGKPAE